MDKYNLKLNLSSMVSELSVSEQQKLEIIKVLYKRSNIIIFDEPTAVLSPNEIKDFLKLVKDLKKDGRTIIIISHKIPELKEVADEATVIRLGRTIKTFEMASMNNSEIAKLMVGREVKESKYPKNPTPFKSESILSVKDLVIHDSSKNIEKVKSVSFDVKAGEILGIAGVEGSGQKEIVDAISGLGKLSSGSITINSRGVLVDISKASIKKRYDNGMAFIPEDRHKHGLVLDETINNNISIRNVDKFSF
jgi:general nucleoside transport system ATP-binding protein